MKINQEHVAQLGHYSLEQWRDDAWQDVAECRQTVGYQFGDDWDCVGCNGTKEQCDALRSQHPGKYVCEGYICIACIVKEIKDWQSAGLAIPVAMAENGRWKITNTTVSHRGTVAESTEDYILNDGRVLATLVRVFNSSDGKFFNVNAGGRVDFKTEFKSYLDDTPSAFEFEGMNHSARTMIEQIAAKIVAGTK